MRIRIGGTGKGYGCWVPCSLRCWRSRARSPWSASVAGFDTSAPVAYLDIFGCAIGPEELTGIGSDHLGIHRSDLPLPRPYSFCWSFRTGTSCGSRHKIGSHCLGRRGCNVVVHRANDVGFVVRWRVCFPRCRSLCSHEVMSSVMMDDDVGLTHAC